MNTPGEQPLPNTVAAVTALESGAIVCPVTPAGLLRFSGEESQSFLHGQLSSDVKSLTEHAAQYSSYSTPKGRMLASFLVFQQHSDYWLQVANDLSATIQKRLSMFILRSKTRCSDASAERALIGIAGPKASMIMQKVANIPELPEMAVHHADHYSLIALPGGRYQFITPPETAAALLQQLIDAGCTPATQELWQLTDIRAGIPWIGAATQEDFVLQMANLDLIGGVSFTKGCYPGQEIVARTRYLGKVKRRMYRAEVHHGAVQTGQDIYSPEMNGQPSGKILSACQISPEIWEMLAVTQISSIEHGLHLESPSGPMLTILPLPYTVE